MSAERKVAVSCHFFLVEFQSPCGDYVSGTYFSLDQKLPKSSVSVPLRGLCQRKDDATLFLILRYLKFQSPCGDYVSGKSGASIESMHLESMFQSPCGDYVSGKLTTRTGFKMLIAAFQSPCGDYVSGKIEALKYGSLIFFGFSPLAGIMSAES